MIERADLLGGTCEAGPNPDRGWTVTAVLPRDRRGRREHPGARRRRPGDRPHRAHDDPRRPAGHRGRRRGRRRAARPSSWPAGCAPTCACSTSACPASTASRPPACSPGRASPTRSPSSSSPRSTSTSTSTPRCGPAPAASCSRTPARRCSPRPSTPPPTATRSSPRASPPGCSRPSPTPGRRAPPRQPDRAAHRPRGAGARAVARGRTNSEIADELHITLSTVKTHIASLMAKLGARNRVEIAMWAYETDRVRPVLKYGRRTGPRSDERRPAVGDDRRHETWMADPGCAAAGRAGTAPPAGCSCRAGSPPPCPGCG